eukprot:TRINITY_DN61551_c0_g1_i1.p1 TRINITY_DN61551_c0_g1~~TRINITY_DN61551_c0_g1_i1.p1  ORF type:complete len:278 (-),score=13.31 TRINITY_DN61551_c0_g1_i1:73-906(-)
MAGCATQCRTGPLTARQLQLTGGQQQFCTRRTRYGEMKAGHGVGHALPQPRGRRVPPITPLRRQCRWPVAQRRGTHGREVAANSSLINHDDGRFPVSFCASGLHNHWAHIRGLGWVRQAPFQIRGFGSPLHFASDDSISPCSSPRSPQHATPQFDAMDMDDGDDPQGGGNVPCWASSVAQPQIPHSVVATFAWTDAAVVLLMPEVVTSSVELEAAHQSHALSKTRPIVWWRVCGRHAACRLGVGLKRPCVGTASGVYPTRLSRPKARLGPISGGSVE